MRSISKWVSFVHGFYNKLDQFDKEKVCSSKYVCTNRNWYNEDYWKSNQLKGSEWVCSWLKRWMYSLVQCWHKHLTNYSLSTNMHLLCYCRKNMFEQTTLSLPSLSLSLSPPPFFLISCVGELKLKVPSRQISSLFCIIENNVSYL